MHTFSPEQTELSREVHSCQCTSAVVYASVGRLNAIPSFKFTHFPPLLMRFEFAAFVAACGKSVQLQPFSCKRPAVRMGRDRAVGSATASARRASFAAFSRRGTLGGAPWYGSVKKRKPTVQTCAQRHFFTPSHGHHAPDISRSGLCFQDGPISGSRMTDGPRWSYCQRTSRRP